MLACVVRLDIAMQIQTPISLLHALEGSGLFSADAMAAIAREMIAFGDDTQAVLRHLVHAEIVPVYQLRKIVHGKTAELFIGPYVVLDKLGEGGMGKVFKARDTRSREVVAVKVVRSHLLENPIVRGRYDREVRAALSLKHPNIAAAIDSGESEGRYYLAMEFVDGLDLAKLVRAHGSLPVPEACEYLRQAALGLQHAHEQGFVHRDIKPSNIVVSGERHHAGSTEPANVKVLDMGLIRSVGFDDDGGGTDLTRDGTVVGTPDYMAPEQAKNSSLVDHRADLYSLGATFYFLLTGKPAFPMGSPIEKILKHQIDPPPPLQAQRPDVPAELARIVGKLMMKKPEMRFATAGEAAEALAPLTRHTTSKVVRIAKLEEPKDIEFASDTLPPSSPTLSRPRTPIAAAEPPAPPPTASSVPASDYQAWLSVSATDRTPSPRGLELGDNDRLPKPLRQSAGHPGVGRVVVALAAAMLLALAVGGGLTAWIVWYW